MAAVEGQRHQPIASTSAVPMDGHHQQQYSESSSPAQSFNAGSRRTPSSSKLTKTSSTRGEQAMMTSNVTAKSDEKARLMGTPSRSERYAWYCRTSTASQTCTQRNTSIPAEGELLRHLARELQIDCFRQQLAHQASAGRLAA